MKKYIMIILAGLVVSLSACETIDTDVNTTSEVEEVEESILYENENDDLEDSFEETSSEETIDDWGSAAALEGVEFTIEEMLIYALQDEFTARSEYEYIMDKFDVEKPFSNIKDSELTHIDLLLPLFETYEYDVPEDNATDHLFDIDTLTEAFAIGVTAEINNIAMYNLFLTYELPQDVEDVFISLRDASLNHLDAFQKNLDRVS